MLVAFEARHLPRAGVDADAERDAAAETGSADPCEVVGYFRAVPTLTVEKLLERRVG